jgi:predicted adenylyl cyclase CyaB
MGRNVEIKARLIDREAAIATAAKLADKAPATIVQEDIFFRCEGARLKLRVFGPERGELIRYERENVAGARTSHYQIAQTSDPQALGEILTRALGQIGVVRKTRLLYLVGQTRIHIDRVEGLGDFLELEVVLREGQSEAEGESIANALLAKFEIESSQLIANAYVDLLARAG